MYSIPDLLYLHSPERLTLQSTAPSTYYICFVLTRIHHVYVLYICAHRIHTLGALSRRHVTRALCHCLKLERSKEGELAKSGDVG